MQLEWSLGESLEGEQLGVVVLLVCWLVVCVDVWFVGIWTEDEDFTDRQRGRREVRAK